LQVLQDSSCGDVWKLQLVELLLQDWLLLPHQAVQLLGMFDRCAAVFVLLYCGVAMRTLSTTQGFKSPPTFCLNSWVSTADAMVFSAAASKRHPEHYLLLSMSVHHP
jgi:hypothetical protein